jgi:ribosomal-protein-alanine N-acetyltransferase
VRPTPQALAAIHARAMTVPAPWTAQTFLAFLSAQGSILTTSGRGFALGRVIADESELLTLAVDPEARRQGHARRCLADLIEAAAARGARRMHLEVAFDNAAALGLYESVGFVVTGRRKGYYTGPDSRPVDALSMTLDFRGD